MLRIVSLFSLLSFTFAIHKTRCGLNTDIGTTFKPTEDGVEARYTLEWCSKVPRNATLWKLQFDSIATKKCNRNVSSWDVYKMKKSQSTVHSIFRDPIGGTFDCNVTCFSTDLDLVFSGCYMVENQVFIGAHNQHVVRDMLLVSNRFAGQGAFNDLKIYYNIERDGDILAVRWDLNYIPISNYTVEISPYSDDNRSYVNWSPVSDCTAETYSLECRLPAPAPRQCVGATLRNAAPWRGGPLFQDKPVMIYCSPPPAEVALSTAARSAALWWGGGAALLLLLLLAALWACHSHILRDLHKRTLRDWTQRYAQYKAGRALKQEEPNHILLLYAQDCAPAMDAVAALKAMLEDSAPGRVLDIFSPECMAQYAPAPMTWLSQQLARRDLKVVLLQTPAAAALYNVPLDEKNLCLQEPLLGRVVQYRSPHYADALLQYALRIIRDTAHEQAEYTKYYIATISSLASELVPQVAALRRYGLPAHGGALLRDLRLPAPAAPRLAALQGAAAALQAFVRARPDYLKDELEYLEPV